MGVGHILFGPKNPALSYVRRCFLKHFSKVDGARAAKLRKVEAQTRRTAK
eukprot:gene436-2316_t